MSDRNEAKTRTEPIHPVIKNAGWEFADGNYVRGVIVIVGRLQDASTRTNTEPACCVLSGEGMNSPEQIRRIL